MFIPTDWGVMGEQEPNEDQIMAELQNLLRHGLSGKIVTNFIIIAEVADEGGQMLSLSISDAMTPWLAYGMLNSAMSMLSSGEYEFPTSENEEEQNG